VPTILFEVMNMLGLRIAALRKMQGWSQAELATRLQISTSAVGMYEQGRREPSLALLVALSELLGVTTDFLLTGRSRCDCDSRQAQQAVAACVGQMQERLEKRSGSGLRAEAFAVLLPAVMTEA